MIYIKEPDPNTFAEYCYGCGCYGVHCECDVNNK